MKLQELLQIAYESTHRFGRGSVNMSSTQSQLVQEFRMDVRPSNNRIPKKIKSGGTIVSCPTGYKELTVWVKFGDNQQCFSPTLTWLYMDRSLKWDGESIKGDINNIDELKRISHELDKEANRLFDIEMEYSRENGSLNGLVIEGYSQI